MITAKYKNTRSDRDKIIESINRLKSAGYERKDDKNLKVSLSLDVLSGKISKKTEIVEYIFYKDIGEIHEVTSYTIHNLAKLKKILFGFTSPFIEAKNAVRAGLIDKNDLAILKSQFEPKAWVGERFT